MREGPGLGGSTPTPGAAMAARSAPKQVLLQDPAQAQHSLQNNPEQNVASLVALDLEIWKLLSGS